MYTAENVSHRGKPLYSNDNGFSFLPVYLHARRYLMPFCPGGLRHLGTIDGRRSSTDGGAGYALPAVCQRCVTARGVTAVCYCPWGMAGY